MGFWKALKAIDAMMLWPLPLQPGPKNWYWGHFNAERERKAGMSKFKVGDKVRRVRHSGVVQNCPLGFETEVDNFLGYVGGGFWYRGKDGSRQNSTNESDWELIEPAHQGPVRTVTTTSKVIEPGEYGRVLVCDHGDGSIRVGITGDIERTPIFRLSASELRAAAETFTQLADALEGGE